MYWLVMAGGAHNEAVKPEKRDDGTLVLASGQSFAPGTWQMFERRGPVPNVPRGSTPRLAGRPKRRDPARGSGWNNTG